MCEMYQPQLSSCNIMVQTLFEQYSTGCVELNLNFNETSNESRQVCMDDAFTHCHLKTAAFSF